MLCRDFFIFSVYIKVAPRVLVAVFIAERRDIPVVDKTSLSIFGLLI